MEEQREIKIKIMPDDDIKNLIDAIKSKASSTLGFEIGEPKIVITENGEKEIVVPFHDPAIEEEVRKK